MKDINEVIRRKEAELQQLQRDIDALHVAARLLSEETEAGTAYAPRPMTSSAYAPPGRPAPAPGAGEAGYGAAWDAAAKRFP
jgi:hypothetical protein